jgi:hypothetical protein
VSRHTFTALLDRALNETVYELESVANRCRDTHVNDLLPDAEDEDEAETNMERRAAEIEALVADVRQRLAGIRARGVAK